MIAVLGSTGAMLSMLAAAPSAGSIHVAGAVKKPGAFVVAKPQSLHEAVRETGGLRADADARRIRITAADGTVRTVDFTKVGTIPAVQPGETVEVPSIDMSKSVVVRGGVSHPGALDYREGMTVLDVLKEAEPSKLAAVEAVKVARVGENGKVEILNADLVAMSTGKAAPLALQPGDTVAVPFAGKQMSDRELLTIVLIALLVIIIVD